MALKVKPTGSGISTVHQLREAIGGGRETLEEKIEIEVDGGSVSISSGSRIQSVHENSYNWLFVWSPESNPSFDSPILKIKE